VQGVADAPDSLLGAPQRGYSTGKIACSGRRFLNVGVFLVAHGYAVSFMQHTTNAGIPSDKARHACGNTMGARVPVSLNGSSNPDTDYTTKPCGKWLEARYHAPALFPELKKLPAVMPTDPDGISMRGNPTSTPPVCSSRVTCCPRPSSRQCSSQTPIKAGLLSSGTGRYHQIGETL